MLSLTLSRCCCSVAAAGVIIVDVMTLLLLLSLLLLLLQLLLLLLSFLMLLLLKWWDLEAIHQGSLIRTIILILIHPSCIAPFILPVLILNVTLNYVWKQSTPSTWVLSYLVVAAAAGVVIADVMTCYCQCSSSSYIIYRSPVYCFGSNGKPFIFFTRISQSNPRRGNGFKPLAIQI